MIPYEDAKSQEMKLAEPEALLPDQDDTLTPDKGDKYIGM